MRLFGFLGKFLLGFFLLIPGGWVNAQTVESETVVPEILKPWIPWVLKEEAPHLCPHSLDESPHCLWFGSLELNLNNQSGDFQLPVKVEAEDFIPLPGNADAWPQDVKVNGAPAPVVLQDNIPQLFLPAGDYVVSGQFAWLRLPKSLEVSPAYGLVNLKVNGVSLLNPNREESGTLWLEQGESVGGSEDVLGLQVFRKVSDQIPLILTTRIELEVSGKAREIELKGFLPEGFVPQALSGSLPVMADAKGALKVQVRPGSYYVTMDARLENQAIQILAPSVSDPWPSSEVWVFEANNYLRQVDVSGAPTVDPQQTSLPLDWKTFPAYLVSSGEGLELTEKIRGNPRLQLDQLNLSRHWWLDFDGQGVTVNDILSGTLNQGWRLEMGTPFDLGNVTIHGVDQFITRLDDKPQVSGVEIRNPQLYVKADSRFENMTRKQPILGWQHHFQSVKGVFHLPPGWSLLAAPGVDQASNTWVSRWSLLDFFLVLIVSMAVAKLFGRRGALLVLLTLILTVTEPGAPKWIWLYLIAFQALLTLVKPGKLHRVLWLGKWGVLISLLMMALPFAVQQVRQGLYPVLQYSWKDLSQSSSYAEDDEGQMNAPWDAMPTTGGFAPPKALPPAPLPEAEPNVPGGVKEAVQDVQLQRADKEIKQELLSNAPSKSDYYSRKSSQKLNEIDPNNLAQTGPGKTQWDWNSAQLIWSGPVGTDQFMTLWLVPPWLNAFLNFLRAFLLLLLVVLFSGTKLPSWMPLKRVLGTSLVLWGLFFGVNQTWAYEIPSKELLEELKEHVTKKTACSPHCVSIPRMTVEANKTQISLRMEVAALQDVALPLPSSKEWLPETLVLDGKPAYSTKGSGGEVWVFIPKGVHQVTLVGAVGGASAINLFMAEKPYHVSSQLDGWILSGVNDSGRATDTLQLALSDSKNKAVDVQKNQNNFLPFVRVERELILGLDWEIETRVTRLSPTGIPLVVNIPLIEGESVTTDEPRIVQGQAIVNIPPQSNSISWRSVLAVAPTLKLSAPTQTSWHEVWKLQANPVWHVTYEGLPVTGIGVDSGVLEWAPWPGESLTLNMTKPLGVAGQTLTIDRVKYEATPGLRAGDHKLDFSLRSSLGGHHAMTLPEGAQILSLAIDGQEQTFIVEKNVIRIPIKPGAQQINLIWRDQEGITSLFKPRALDLGIPMVNVETRLKLSSDRWVLLLGGPGYGPAILFWGYVLVLVLVSVGLARTSYSLLSTPQWVLLGLGLTQVSVEASLFVVGWLLLLGWRLRGKIPEKAFWFNLCQIMIVTMTLIAFGVLFASIKEGLLGSPQMQIQGNGSTASMLQWFIDRTQGALPQPWVLSVPLWIYRVSMLLWALWLAFAILKWLKMGWAAFVQGGGWKKLPRVKKTTLQSESKETPPSA